MIALIALLASVPDAQWHSATMNAPVSDVGVTIYNGRLYVAGGYSAATTSSDVQFAPLGGDGSVGGFSSAGTLPNATGALGAVTQGSTFFVAGGNIDIPYFSPVASDGSLGTFQAGSTLGRAPYGQGLISAGTRLYAVGGAHVSGTSPNFTYTYFTDVSVGTPGPGTLTWQAGAALPVARARHGLATDGSYIYVAGGQLSQTQYTKEVLVSSIGGNGLNLSWSPVTPLPTPRQGAQAFVYNGFLFVLGGQQEDFSVLGDVLQARILSGGAGALGAWIQTTSFPQPRYSHGAAVSPLGYAYVAGGFATDYTADVEWKQLATPGPATQLVAGDGPSGATVDECAGPFTLALLDATNAPTWADGDLAVLINAGGAYVATKSDCSDQVGTTLLLKGGKDSMPFYVRWGSPGEITITPSHAGMSGESTHITVSAALDPHTVNGWSCSSGGFASWIALLALLACRPRRRANVA